MASETKIARALVGLSSVALFVWGAYYTMFGVNMPHKVSSLFTMVFGLIVFGIVVSQHYVPSTEDENFR